MQNTNFYLKTTQPHHYVALVKKYQITMPSAKLLPSALQNSLEQVVALANQRGASLRATTLSTTEGVPLGRVYAPGEEAALDAQEALTLLETVWAPPSKQLPVLGTKVQHTTAFYNHGVLVHLYLAPLVVTCLCKTTCNLSAIQQTTLPLLQQVLEPLQNTLLESLKPEEEEGITSGQ